MSRKITPTYDDAGKLTGLRFETQISISGQRFAVHETVSPQQITAKREQKRQEQIEILYQSWRMEQQRLLTEQAERGEVVVKGRTGRRTDKASVDKGQISITDFINQTWLPGKAGTCTLSSVESYKVKLKPIIKFFGKTQLKAIDEEMLREFLAELRRMKCKTGKQFKASSVNDVQVVLSDIFHTAERLRYISENPWARLSRSDKKLPRGETRRDFLDTEERQAFLTALETEPTALQAELRLMLESGIRRGELSCLQWADVDFQRQQLSITKTLTVDPSAQSGFVVAPTTKTGHCRTVPLTAKTAGLLQELNKGIRNPKAYIFHKRGCETEPSNYNVHHYRLTAFCKRHGLRTVSPHAMRRTAATMLLSVSDAKTVSRILGHDVNVLLKCYAQTDETAKRNAITRAWG